MISYPSPCLSCTVAPKSCKQKNCSDWRMRYFYRQKQINAYAKKVSGGFAYVKDHVWGYMHPDEYRRYLLSDPCRGCLCREWCDDHCLPYLAHFQAKMEYLRKRPQIHE